MSDLMTASCIMTGDTRNSFWTKNERNRKIYFGRKMKFTILDEIWTKNERSTDRGKKFSNSFTFIGITTMLLQLG